MKPRGPRRLFGWRRVAVVLAISGVLGLLLSTTFKIAFYIVVARAMFVGLVCMVAFGIFEQWPERLPRWLARWALQVLAVAFVVPFAVLALYAVTTLPGAPPFWRDEARLTGFVTTTMLGLLAGPWVAVAALFRQRELALQTQAQVFHAERGELERKALDARLRLLQAQVEPHFLFNTLANVRELVVSGSPQAAQVLESLIAYLRAAVPRLHDAATTMGEELQLVRAYLELMRMRMPDRLQFEIRADPAAMVLRCPPTTLLTLVENAVRHGIDPSEEGGRIEIVVELRQGRCRAQVRDTGVAVASPSAGLGTGLATLRERLQLVFSGDAHLRVAPEEPHGMRAEVEFPAQPAAA